MWNFTFTSSIPRHHYLFTNTLCSTDTTYIKLNGIDLSGANMAIFTEYEFWEQINVNNSYKIGKISEPTILRLILNTGDTIYFKILYHHIDPIPLTITIYQSETPLIDTLNMSVNNFPCNDTLSDTLTYSHIICNRQERAFINVSGWVNLDSALWSVKDTTGNWTSLPARSPMYVTKTTDTTLVRLILNTGDTIYFRIRYATNSLQNYFANDTINPIRNKTNTGGFIMLKPDSLSQEIILPNDGCDYKITGVNEDDYDIIPQIDTFTNKLTFTLKSDECTSGLTICKACDTICPESDCYTLHLHQLNPIYSITDDGCSGVKHIEINHQCVGKNSSTSTMDFIIFNIINSDGEIVFSGNHIDTSLISSGSYSIICIDTLSHDTTIIASDININILPQTEKLLKWITISDYETFNKAKCGKTITCGISGAIRLQNKLELKLSGIDTNYILYDTASNHLTIEPITFQIEMPCSALIYSNYTLSIIYHDSLDSYENYCDTTFKLSCDCADACRLLNSQIQTATLKNTDTLFDTPPQKIKQGTTDSTGCLFYYSVVVPDGYHLDNSNIYNGSYMDTNIQITAVHLLDNDFFTIHFKNPCNNNPMGFSVTNTMHYRLPYLNSDETDTCWVEETFVCRCDSGIIITVDPRQGTGG